MQERFKQLVQRYQELERLISDPKVLAQPAQYNSLLKEMGNLARVVERIQALETIQKQKVQVQTLLETPETEHDLREIAQEEINSLSLQAEKIQRELEEILLSDVQIPQVNIIIEIRAGVGGEESALFAADLFRMYAKYSEKKLWKLTLIDSNPTDLGGFKEIIFSLEGQDVYKYLRFESGTHRVQRVPRTEASGRIHTSTCTVAVMPEPEAIEIEIKPEDLKIDTFRAGGPGGQHVNKTSSAVRITHLPTGLVVSCQSERSQHRNRDMALRLLRAKLYEQALIQKKEQYQQLRRTQIGTGNRSEKIRTYNFPQNRVTDHRINFSVYHLDKIMAGQLDDLIERLIEADRKMCLEEGSPKVKISNQI